MGAELAFTTCGRPHDIEGGGGVEHDRLVVRDVGRVEDGVVVERAVLEAVAEGEHAHGWLLLWAVVVGCGQATRWRAGTRRAAGPKASRVMGRATPEAAARIEVVVLGGALAAPCTRNPLQRG